MVAKTRLIDRTKRMDRLLIIMNSYSPESQTWRNAEESFQTYLRSLKGKERGYYNRLYLESGGSLPEEVELCLSICEGGKQEFPALWGEMSKMAARLEQYGRRVIRKEIDREEIPFFEAESLLPNLKGVAI